MATFKFHCPHCGQPIEADDRLKNQISQCPTCGKNIIINQPNDRFDIFLCDYCKTICSREKEFRELTYKCEKCKKKFSPILGKWALQQEKIEEEKNLKEQELKRQEQLLELHQKQQVWSKTSYKVLILKFNEAEKIINMLAHQEGWRVISHSTVFLSESTAGFGGFEAATRKEGLAVILQKDD